MSVTRATRTSAESASVGGSRPVAAATGDEHASEQHRRQTAARLLDPRRRRYPLGSAAPKRSGRARRPARTAFIVFGSISP